MRLKKSVEAWIRDRKVRGVFDDVAGEYNDLISDLQQWLSIL